MNAKAAMRSWSIRCREAVITLKQGAGRLIRDETDRGVLMICDLRLVEKPTARIWRSLPPMSARGGCKMCCRFFTQQGESARSSRRRHDETDRHCERAAGGLRRAQRIEVVQGDITRDDVDAIVNAANSLAAGRRRRGRRDPSRRGPGAVGACRLSAVCPTGEARITPGFRLPRGT